MPGERTSDERASVELERVDIVSADGREFLAATLVGGAMVLRPLDWYPSLAAASARDRSKWRLIGGGHGVSWPALDLDLSAEGLLAGRPDMTRSARDRLPVDAMAAAMLARHEASPRSRIGSLAALLGAKLKASERVRLAAELERRATPKRATPRAPRRRRSDEAR
ncbi:MAG: DUF2442 domain-containing protein [Planctomycetota bacterium]|nr:DUF2442 domain-containing protein [Planctomycetota bacterium]